MRNHSHSHRKSQTDNSRTNKPERLSRFPEAQSRLCCWSTTPRTTYSRKLRKRIRSGAQFHRCSDTVRPALSAGSGNFPHAQTCVQRYWDVKGWDERSTLVPLKLKHTQAQGSLRIKRDNDYIGIPQPPVWQPEIGTGKSAVARRVRH